MTEQELEEFIAAGARVLGLPVEDAWKPTIRAHLEVNLRLAAEVVEFALADEIEPAPVFEIDDLVRVSRAPGSQHD